MVLLRSITAKKCIEYQERLASANLLCSGKAWWVVRMTFGVIGFGAFGKLLSTVLAKYGNVLIYSKRDIAEEAAESGARQAEFEEVAKCKIIIIATGLNEFEEVCSKLANFVGPKTLVMDVCSVKVKPAQIMSQHLSDKCGLMTSHPLFGPQSASNGDIKGQKIVVHPLKLSVSDFAKVKSLLRDILGLQVIEMTPEEHDHQMAWVHGLTFFVGRGLMSIDPPKSELTTAYYQKLLDLVELEKSHSEELFNTIEAGNPYAAEIRQKFIGHLETLENELKEYS